MNKERLLKLAELLENLPEGRPKFSLENWYHCGTAACAVGHAAIDPWFRRRGLKLIKIGRWHEPAYRDDEGWSAVAAFFGIYIIDAEFLFSAESYDRGDRRSVARRIRKFVKEGSPW